MDFPDDGTIGRRCAIRTRRSEFEPLEGCILATDIDGLKRRRPSDREQVACASFGVCVNDVYWFQRNSGPHSDSAVSCSGI